MNDPERYAFHPARLADLPLLRRWQGAPHVRRWWGDTDPYDATTLEDPRVSRWIVAIDGRPFAYMQDYSVHGWGHHHFGHLACGSRGIDQYIGDPRMIGHGHGPAFICQRMKALFDGEVPFIATDPHPGNARAIAAYAKVGFCVAGSAQQTGWGLVLPMIAPNERRAKSSP